MREKARKGKWRTLKARRRKIFSPTFPGSGREPLSEQPEPRARPVPCAAAARRLAAQRGPLEAEQLLTLHPPRTGGEHELLALGGISTARLGLDAHNAPWPDGDDLKSCRRGVAPALHARGVVRNWPCEGFANAADQAESGLPSDDLG